MLLVDVEVLWNPGAHTLHLGWLVAEPGVCVYLPGGHLVWAMQESILELLLDLEAAKNPVGHDSHVMVESIA